MLCHLSPTLLKYSPLCCLFSFSHQWPTTLNTSLHVRRTTPPHLSLYSPTSSSRSQNPKPLTNHQARVSNKKLRRQSPEYQLRNQLDMCSKTNNLLEALRLYDVARASATPLSLHHYNVLLYLCSTSPDADADTVERGFRIFRQMTADGIPPNEATYTSLARLAAAAADDPGLAFQLVKEMSKTDNSPRLRSYCPALFGFCKKGELHKAWEVDAHMLAAGVAAEEPQLAALMQVSSESGSGERVYRVLHRMRTAVRRVSESTAEVVECWFRSEAAAEVGEEVCDVEKVKEGVVKGGGGWHGQGWLGKGNWRVVRAKMDKNGVCGCCGEKLVCIDIDPLETENFARSLSDLACRKEVNADFTSFQEWLTCNGPFEAVIDGANVGLFKRQSFSFSQLNSVVKGIQQKSSSKKFPLILLHNRRVKGGLAESPFNKKLLESWRRSGALYATPVGSSDDWYWLYAAVSSKCLLVTNDEMRDHLFELLGNSFFPRWKEKHQIRFAFSKGKLVFCMPPPYSVVIQESEEGSWHVPIATDDDIDETNRQWICATRPSNILSSNVEKKRCLVH